MRAAILSRTVFVRSIPAVLAASLLAACAALPAAEKAGALGGAISATGKYVRDTLDANRTLAIKLGEERQAQQYMMGAAFTLNDDPRWQIPQRLVGPRLAAIAALEQYGDAVAKAVDQGTVDKLEQASVNLGNAAAGLALAAGPEAVVAAPVIKVVARVSGFLIGSAYAAEIHGVIVARNQSVKDIVSLLRADMFGAASLIEVQAIKLRRERAANLQVMRGECAGAACKVAKTDQSLVRSACVSDGCKMAKMDAAATDGDLDPRKVTRIDRTLLYNEYKAARQDVTSAFALVQAAKKYDAVLTALADAHEAVATDQPDGELLLRRFVALSAELSDLIKEVRKENP